MAKLLDLVKFDTVTTGTGTITIGTTATGFFSPSEAGGIDGDIVRYIIRDGINVEEGIGTLGSSTSTLTRTVQRSKIAGIAGTTKLTLSGTAVVALVASGLDILNPAESSNLTADQQVRVRANIDVTKKNYIINGGMMVSQENGTSSGTASGYYPVDKFNIDFSNAGVITAQQVSSLTPGGSPNRLRVTVTTADASVAAGDYARIFHRIEGRRIADLKLGTAAAKSFTYRFGVKAPAGTYSVVFSNSAGNRGYVADFTIAGGEANTDVVKSVTVPGDQSGTWLNTNGIGMVVQMGLMAGSTYHQAPGSWLSSVGYASSSQFNFLGTISNVFELFDVSLTEGDVAPPSQLLDYAQTIRDCQREFWKPSLDTDSWLNPIDGSNNFRRKVVFFPVQMRATPTITASGTVSSGSFTNGSLTTSGASPDRVQLIGDVSAAGALARVDTLTANARL